MWLTSSSIGRKFVMALTGICLVLFVTFHVLMNSVAIFCPAAYNKICMLLGANWYAVVASMGLAAIFIIHIIYAVWLTVQNRRARGENRYEVTSLPPHVEWESKNMLVLGIVILAFLVVHMAQFWYKMQWTELVCKNPECWATVGGAVAAPEFGTLYLQSAFSHILTPIVYIIAFIALWFHMNHGFWSMFQTIGWNNRTWLPRLKCIANAWVSIVIVLFVAQALVFTYMAKENKFLTSEALQEQYAEFWGEQAACVVDSYEIATASVPDYQYNQFMEEQAPIFKEKAEFILKNYAVQCGEVQNLDIVRLQCMLCDIDSNEVFECSEAEPCCNEGATCTEEILTEETTEVTPEN